jgi:myo-inositol-1(or 4)-monophosphatase
LAATERNRLQENECFKAGRQRGATLNDKPIKVSTTNEVDKSLLATGFPYDHRDFRDFFDFFKAFMIRCQGIRGGSSAALDLCYLACGRLDGFWEWKLNRGILSRLANN